MAKTKKTNKLRNAAVIAVLLAVVLLIGVAAYGIQREIKAKEARLLNISAPVDPESLIPRSTYDVRKFVWGEDGRVTYEDDVWTTRTGIDVSSFQYDVDWEDVAADGIEFAIIRLGYRGYGNGALREDEYFRENLEGALAAGLEVGIYFFSQAISIDEAREEAAYVMKLLDGAELKQPVYYDWEPIYFDTARTDGLPGDVVTANARAFCETIEAGGYEAGIYFNQHDIYNVIELENLTDFPLWYAQYNETPDMIYDFWCWQYTDQGVVEGVATTADLSIQFVRKEP